MDEYISREAVFQVVHGIARGIADGYTEALKAKDMKAFYMAKGAKEILDSVDTDLCYVPVADVQPVDRWISVKDRLPDKFDYVLCYCKTTTGEGNVFMYGAYHKDTWWLKTCRTYATLEQPQMRVMYWMPLPEPPQD